MIYGKRVRLRAPGREDLPNFVGWLNDPEVISGLSINMPMSMEDEERWYQNMLESPPEQHPMVIEIKADGKWKPIGNCGFHQIDWRNRSSEVGIFIGEKGFWNKGYGTEALQLLLRHGFNTLNLNPVALRVFENNPGALLSYEKAGFIHEGRFRKAEFQHGQYWDVHFMSVLRSEWQDVEWSKEEGSQ